MKGIDKLMCVGQVRGIEAGTGRERAVSWSEKLEISGWLQKKVEELSKGMQQKIQFIAALLHDPDFIIMDEPFGGLDPVNTVLLKDVLLEMKHAGKTILFSTHQMEQVERLCDAITLLNVGEPLLEVDLNKIQSSY